VVNIQERTGELQARKYPASKMLKPGFKGLRFVQAINPSLEQPYFKRRYYPFIG
jgi:hypothetical protein